VFEKIWGNFAETPVLKFQQIKDLDITVLTAQFRLAFSILVLHNNSSDVFDFNRLGLNFHCENIREN